MMHLVPTYLPSRSSLILMKITRSWQCVRSQMLLVLLTPGPTTSSFFFSYEYYYYEYYYEYFLLLLILLSSSSFPRERGWSRWQSNELVKLRSSKVNNNSKITKTCCCSIVESTIDVQGGPSELGFSIGFSKSRNVI